MFIGTETVAEMRMMLPTEVTELVKVGGVVPGSAPPFARPFFNGLHLSRTPKLLVRLDYETNSRVPMLWGWLQANPRGILGPASCGIRNGSFGYSVLDYTET